MEEYLKETLKKSKDAVEKLEESIDRLSDTTKRAEDLILKSKIGRDPTDHDRESIAAHGLPKYKVGQRVGIVPKGLKKPLGRGFVVSTMFWADKFQEWVYYVPFDGIYQAESDLKEIK